MKTNTHLLTTLPRPEWARDIPADQPLYELIEAVDVPSEGEEYFPLPIEDYPEVMTVEELAELLRIERKTIYHLIQKGEIPGVRRIGKQIRISRSAVLRYLEEGNGAPERRRRW